MTEPHDSSTNQHVPLIAIVGRPNVGKSALFNRLTRTRAALVEDLPGTTRDRNYGDLEWRGRRLRVVDTGGLLGDEPEELNPLVREAVEHAINEADALLFIVDGVDGPTAPDYEIAAMLRRAAQPLLLVCRSGARSHRACLALQDEGFEHLTNMVGGMIAWNKAGFPVSKT